MNRPKTELDDMADRITQVMNHYKDRLPLKSEDVDLRLVAELGWALGINVDINFIMKKI